MNEYEVNFVISRPCYRFQIAWCCCGINWVIRWRSQNTSTENKNENVSNHQNFLRYFSTHISTLADSIYTWNSWQGLMDCIHSIKYHVLPQEALAEVPFLSGCRKLPEYMAPTLYDEFDLAIPKLDIKLKILNCKFWISYSIYLMVFQVNTS